MSIPALGRFRRIAKARQWWRPCTAARRLPGPLVFILSAALSGVGAGCAAPREEGRPAEKAQAVEARHAVSAADESLREYPIMRGWPVALPGEVTGTPVVADIDGDKDLEVLAPCMDRGQRPLAHPQANIEGLLFAFHHDGTPVRGWPAVVIDRETRLMWRKEHRGYSEDWANSPSVADWDHDGCDEIIALKRVGTVTIQHTPRGPEVELFHPLGDGWSNVPIVDVNGDGVLEAVFGGVVQQLDGAAVPGWPEERWLKHGFTACIGDANGDGAMEVYHTHALDSQMFPGTICGYDSQGNVLPGSSWPQPVGRQCLFGPVMGDVTGDGMMEVVAADQKGHILAGTWDGRPFGANQEEPPFESVFKSDILASGASPTLADLDGDRAAEIIVHDARTRAIRAWHGDGSGVVNADGIVATVGSGYDIRGVTAGDLGGDGVPDLSAGTYWVRLTPDGPVTVNMLPAPAASVTQCTITDLNQDGLADILFALTDGRVVVYETKQSYRPEWMDWPTSNGDFRHTGCWTPRKSARAL